jgi:hypothetical protein
VIDEREPVGVGDSQVVAIRAERRPEAVQKRSSVLGTVMDTSLLPELASVDASTATGNRALNGSLLPESCNQATIAP